MATQFAPSIPTKRLAAPILSTDMAFSLNNYLSWSGVTLVAADFQSTSARGVFRNTANTQVEFFTWDPSTIAGPITILTRGNDYRGGTADGVQTKYNWSANSTLVELGSNPPSEAEDYVDKTSSETIASGAVKTFLTSPVVPTGGTGTQAANANDIAAAITGASGTATNLVNGTVKLSVAAASGPNPIAVGDNDPRMTLATTSGSAYNSSTNKLVDAADVSAAAASGKIVRATGTALPALSGANLTNIASTQISGLILTVGFKDGTTSKNAADASTTQNIAHGLGVVPKWVELEFYSYAGGGGSTGPLDFAKAVYNGTTQSSISCYQTGAATTSVVDNTFTLNNSTSNGQTQVGVVTFDATNIIITWAKTGSPTGTYSGVWKAFA